MCIPKNAGFHGTFKDVELTKSYRCDHGKWIVGQHVRKSDAKNVGKYEEYERFRL